MRLNNGTCVIGGTMLLMMLVGGDLVRLAGVAVLAVSVTWLTVKYLEETVKGIYQDMENQLRARAMAITDKEARRKTDEQVSTQLDNMEEQYAWDITGIRRTSIFLGLAILAWPWLGIVALLGFTAGWLMHLKSTAASWKDVVAEITKVNRRQNTAAMPPQPAAEGSLSEDGIV